jgi:hypothetical protein
MRSARTKRPYPSETSRDHGRVGVASGVDLGGVVEELRLDDAERVAPDREARVGFLEPKRLDDSLVREALVLLPVAPGERERRAEGAQRENQYPTPRAHGDAAS